jgi:radical SAM protein with 4Fe4S-binding SPASM domain
MCYFWGESGSYSKSKGKPKVLDFDILKGLIEELANTESKQFYSLFGGEPLTYPHLEELVLTIKNTKGFIDTPTNGILLAENAKMFVRTGFDQVRVSLDGTQEINDYQRGRGSYEKVLNGINELHFEKQRLGFTRPRIGILFTITKNNFQSIEDFFLNNPDLDLNNLYSVTFQMQNFITEEMGNEYENFLNTEFGIYSEKKWKGLVRDIEELKDINVSLVSNQVNIVFTELKKSNVSSIFLPPTYSPENLSAYLKADWHNMVDLYETCPSPWSGVEITASGEVTPCHIFHDFILGNLYESNFSDIWNGEKYTKFLDFMKNNKFMPICNIGCCILYIAGKQIANRELKK